MRCGNADGYHALILIGYCLKSWIKENQQIRWLPHRDLIKLRLGKEVYEKVIVAPRRDNHHIREDWQEIIGDLQP